MLRTRVMPCLLLKDKGLVKTIKFKKYNYIADPINTVRIFNELEVDELMFLDITASRENRDINFDILREIASECFMPLSYGGNIKKLDDAKKIFEIGFEKLVINASIFENPSLIMEIAKQFGSQSIIGSLDVKKSKFFGMKIYSHNGSIKQKGTPVEWAKKIEELGVGEIMLSSIDRDGTWSGYDIDLISEIAEIVTVPIIANCGAGSIQHLVDAVKKGKASAVAVGSMVVYQKKDKGILINFPSKDFINRF